MRRIGDLKPDFVGIGDNRARRRTAGAQQTQRVWMARIAEDLLGRSDFDDTAEIHHRDPVAQETRHAKIVGDENEAHAGLAVHPLEQIEHLGAYRHVKLGGRFVGDDDPRLHADGARHRYPLELAARKLVRIAAGVFGTKADALEQSGNFIGNVLLRTDAVQPQRQRRANFRS